MRTRVENNTGVETVRTGLKTCRADHDLDALFLRNASRGFRTVE